ncbi:bifunctional diguanylate cyclase/phosphodiesterase [Novosphingobium sp. PhB165]|uniref:putative bifunctional diguanylate cyclase/phosphodiesterase n=1 Tax=Novosphingobium sp. PhB165 TaxID=2485105 RepID=UPI001FB22A3A|nr:bifunctional diguanylate cyclase/phosphodiesterase [Novosphingobium sp. PhB165]
MTHPVLRRLSFTLKARHFWPVILLLLACFGSVLFLIALTTRAQDGLEQQREQQAVEGAVRTLAVGVQHDLQDYAKWDDAVRHISMGLQPGWVDDNVVAYLGRIQGYEDIFILNGRDETIYSFRHPQAPAHAAQETLGPAFTRSIDEVRKMPREGSPIEAGFSRQGNRIVTYSTAAIVPLTPKVSIPADHPTFMLVIAHAIDAPTLARITQELRLSTVQLSLAPPEPSSASVALKGTDGTTLGWLAWAPHQPGTRLLRQVAPAIVALGLLSVAAAILIFQNNSRTIEALRQSELRARHHAGHDSLTGLPNRRTLLSQISAHLAAGDDLTLLFMDLDGFKDANDVYGHAAGDLLLKEAAARVRSIAQGELVARAGGDEFAVLLSRDMARDADCICENIIRSFEAPFVIGAYRVTLGISIGCADAADVGPEGQDELMRRADVAMYAAKGDGKNCTRKYAVNLDEGHLLRMKLERDLQASIAGKELYVHYQPIVASDNARIVAVEALVRWRHPEHGDVPPDVFIPIAELSGLINAVGRQVLYQACLAMRETALELAVNISPVQFWDHNLLDDVRHALQETQFPPERLELEITESLLLRRPDKAAQVINRLRELGVRIALDDFGTGYASIGYLQRLKLDRIKIDKAFVAPLSRDARSREMMLSIVALANAFDAEVTAEGVETEEQARIARAAGCTRMQGWHFGRPTSVEELCAALGPEAQSHPA